MDRAELIELFENDTPEDGVFAEGAIRLTDLDDAIIGLGITSDGSCLAYSERLILQVLRDGMVDEDEDDIEEMVLDWYDYNVLGVIGNGPIIIVQELHSYRKN